MRFSTHMLLSSLVAILSLKAISIEQSLGFIIGIFIGTIAPDIDLITSKVGRLLQHPARVFQTIFKHRGLTHSIYIPLAVFLATLTNAPTWSGFGFGFFLGYLAHLFLDGFTKSGIRLLWPFVRIKGCIATGSFEERLLAILLIIACIAALLA
ncbi:metal-dependent hydrolase [Candidatus Woesearchaeota archaeon]|nr:metal-dependent hydrolase [Candidatus Woesearchaeota archaeon]